MCVRRSDFGGCEGCARVQFKLEQLRGGALDALRLSEAY